MDEEDDDLFNEIEEINKNKNNKVQFKRKPTTNKKLQRTKISFNNNNINQHDDDSQEDNDDDDDDDNRGISNIKTTSKISFRKKLTKSISPDPIKRPIDLSKYRKNNEDHEDDEEMLLEFNDEDDLENIPTIVNIDELNDPKFDKLREKYKSSQIFPPPLSSKEEEQTKKYVPIETNRMLNDDTKISIRKYANALIDEYKDEKNYDDGTENQNQNQKVNDGGDGDGDGDGEVQLNDEDMGTLNSKIDFNNKFNFEIQSDDDDDDDNSNNEEQQEIKQENQTNILTIKEQIQNITRLIKQFEITNKEKQNLLSNLIIEKQELSNKKQEVIEKLNNLII